jgi:hypothetical protein
LSTPDPKPKVRYCNPVPETLRNWCDALAHQIQEVDSGHGYAFESRNGFACDVLLRPGWSMSDDCVHTIIEPTVKAMLAQLRILAECDCDDCKKASTKA